MRSLAMAACLAVLLGGCRGESNKNHEIELSPFPNASFVKQLDGGTITPAEMDAAVTKAMRGGKVTGLGLAILNDSNVVYLRGYGLRNVAEVFR